jgi:AFG3 family protein
MEEEVNNILQEARTRCRSIVEEKKNLIQALADELVLKETLNGDEIVKILG